MIYILIYTEDCDLKLKDVGYGIVQFSGSVGSVCFFGPPDPSISKQKNLEKPWFQLFRDFLMPCVIFEDCCKCIYSKYRNKQTKIKLTKLIFFCISKTTGEKSRVRIRTVLHIMSRIQNTGIFVVVSKFVW
jgi:hypothetical protein